jgi:hypothetical protein
LLSSPLGQDSLRVTRVLADVKQALSRLPRDARAQVLNEERTGSALGAVQGDFRPGECLLL